MRPLLRTLASLLVLAGACFAQNSLLTFNGAVAGPTLAFVAEYQSTSCTTATTCAIPSVTLASGDYAEILCNTVNADSIVNASIGGTTVDDNWRSTATSAHYWSAAHIASASVVSAATVTLTLGATTGGAQCSLYRFLPTGGTPSLDATCDLGVASGLSSPFAGCSMTLTGTGDIIVEAASADVNVTVVSAPWTGVFATDETGAGTARATGLSSGFTAPNWTATSVTKNAHGGVAIGFTPTASQPSTMLDFSGGTNAGVPTATTLWASTFGATGGSPNSSISGDNTFYSIGGNAGSALTYATAAHMALLGTAPRFTSGGATYTDAGTVGLNVGTSGINSQTATVNLNFPDSSVSPAQGTSTAVLSSAQFITSLPQSASINCDCLGIYGGGSGGTTFTNMIVSGNGSQLVFDLEGKTVGTTIPFSTSTEYQTALEYGTGTLTKVAIYDSTGVQVGNTMTGVAANGAASVLKIGQNLSSACTGACASQNMQWDKVQTCYLGCTDAQFPLGIKVKVSPVVDSPGAGTYSNTATVTLTAVNSTTIWFTTDGSTPACGGGGTSTQYSTGFAITTTSTLKAIGCTSNAKWVNGAVLSSVYTITAGITTGNPTSCVAPPAGANCDGTILTSAGTASLSGSVTIPTNSGNHPALVVNIVQGQIATGCTFNSVAMTAMQASKADGAGTAKVTQFLMINPPTGTHTLVCTQTSSAITLLAQPVFGVNQTGTVGNSWRALPTSTNDGGSGTATSTITVTTVANDFVIDCTNIFNDASFTVGSTIAQVQLYNSPNNVGGSNGIGVSYFVATGVSTTMTWTMASTFWSHCAVALIPG